ncbi:nuclear apoptosis-inducing factor 1-like isoform X2 [Gigantopelta aegis]|uniref:nuclear apoptosis-inducing factor 1-like isoform X2 n=1 Tax=Gigantopelta aegis TaxID=1735272 RepID=UPI001B88D017|nr:nuclear apoptosis-inducing factor 1-like isoform X2 [Gigantopelta aegis]
MLCIFRAVPTREFNLNKVNYLAGQEVSMVDYPHEHRQKRRPKFNSLELEALVDAVSIYQNTIYAKFCDFETNSKKHTAWVSVTASVNAVSTVRRSVDEIRRKWRDWSSVIKNKEQRRRRAQNNTEGGNRIITMAPVEEKVVTIIGKTAIEGINCGTDSSAADTSCSESMSPSAHAASCSKNACVEGMPVECTWTVTNRIPPTSITVMCSADSRTAELAERNRSAELAERIRSAELAERNRSAELAERIRSAELAERNRSAELTERNRSRSRSSSPHNPDRRTRVKHAKRSRTDLASTEASSSPDDSDPTHQLVQIERSRLKVEQERLFVEKRRLQLEEKKIQLLQTLVSAMANSNESGIQNHVNESPFSFVG